MMKTNTSKKTLTINNKKITTQDKLNEGWGEVAGTMATDGSWTKIASTALKGSWSAWQRAWNTGVVLPWKLGWAFKDGKSIADVMTVWENKDRELRKKQEQIITQTGVAETVEAFTAVCNPALFALDQFNQAELKDYRDKLEAGAEDVWDNTLGRIWPELKLEKNVSKKSSESKIVFYTFIREIVINDFVTTVNKDNLPGISSQKEFLEANKQKDFNLVMKNASNVSENNPQFKSFIQFIVMQISSGSDLFDPVKGNTQGYPVTKKMIFGC